ITSGIVRYYFNSSKCPEALVVDGQVCDQIVLGGILHSARARGAPSIQYFLNPSKPSPHALKFGADGSIVETVSPPANPVAVSGSKRGRQSSVESSAGEQSASSADHSTREVEVSSGSPSSNIAKEPPSSKHCLEPPRSPPFRSPPRKRLAKRVPSQDCERPRAFYSPNYWAELDNVSVSFNEQSVCFGKEDVGLRLSACELGVPDGVRSSNEYANFMEVRRRQAVCSAEPTSIAKALVLLEEDMALQEAIIARDLEVAAKLTELEPTQKETTASTSDELVRSMQRNQIHFVGKLFRLMRTKSPIMEDYVRVHLISRAVHATLPLWCAPVADKWKKIFGENCPSSRTVLFDQSDRWVLDENEIELYAMSEALALFELLLMTAAPDIFCRDLWVHVLCGFDAPWIGASPVRLLHPNLLLGLLRSDLGLRLMKFVESSKWESSCLRRLQSLRTSDVWLPEDSGILVVTFSSLGAVWGATTLSLPRA
ncbi:Choline/Carnitine Oacyltransferase, partial [Phytophthora megakarya]